MITTDQLTPEIEMKAREYINLGYQRLLTFECPNGGFSWYGNEPGKPILTAYGLMEFTDMARVHYVDPAMIQRTQEWLLGKQKSDGSWPPDDHDLFNVLNTTLQSTAYATWALIHSGYSLSDNRIAVFAADSSTYTFVPAAEDKITVEVVLIFRRAFIDLADRKGWQVPDIVMEKEVIGVSDP